jgi:hypothetical protein
VSSFTIASALKTWTVCFCETLVFVLIPEGVATQETSFDVLNTVYDIFVP